MVSEKKLIYLHCDYRLSIAAITAATVILCMPTLFAHQIYPQNVYQCFKNGKYQGIYDLTENATVSCDQKLSETRYSVGFSSLVLKNNCALLKINLWLTGIILKVSNLFLSFFVNSCFCFSTLVCSVCVCVCVFVDNLI